MNNDYTYIGKDGKSVLARDLEDERDELKARIAEIEAQQVAVVNPLVWDRDCDGSMTADGIFGEYTVYYDGGYGWLAILDGSDDEWVKYPCEETGFNLDIEGCAACEAHHNARILSAITLKSEAEVRADERAKVLGEALELEYTMDHHGNTLCLINPHAVEAMHTPESRAIAEKDTQ